MPLAGSAAAFVIPDAELLSAVTEHGVADNAEAKLSRQNPLDAALEMPSSVIDYIRPFAKDSIDWLTGKDDERPVSEHLSTTDDSSHDGLDALHKHDKSNLTVYQLISESKYTTKLAAIVSQDNDLIKALNDTSANCTLFAPTDKAFEKIPHHGHKPSKDFIKKLIMLHISGDLYPATRVLKAHTIPTLVDEDKLGGLQRLAVKLGLKGLTINTFSRVVAINIFGKNGVIHGIDSVLMYPPPTLPIIEATPSVFSTLALGLTRTKLFKDLKDTPHTGGTFFAPSNRAFAKLGAKVNAFLFSKYGNKYLKALLQYHVVYNATLYSNAYYHTDDALVAGEEAEHAANGKDGHYHLDLPTQLEDRSLPIDIARWGPFISIKVNGYVDVTYSDVVAQDGVIQVVGNVLIPPKKLSLADGAESISYWDGVSELAVEDVIKRLEPFVKDDDEESLEDTLPTHEPHHAEDVEKHLSEWKEYL